jgi:hypothetical protein
MSERSSRENSSRYVGIYFFAAAFTSFFAFASASAGVARASKRHSLEGASDA